MVEERRGRTERRGFLRLLGRISLGGVLGGLTGTLGWRRLRGQDGDELVWQIDPDLCTGCGKCSTHCVLQGSAARCYQEYDRCGYCDLCSGFFDPNYLKLNEGAENQICPTAAIQRRFIEEPYYEYRIDRDLCIGCGDCVKYCELYGNGSFYLQISQALCRHCNECSIARACPAEALRRVPRGRPYIGKGA